MWHYVQEMERNTVKNIQKPTFSGANSLIPTMKPVGKKEEAEEEAKA